MATDDRSTYADSFGEGMDPSSEIPPSPEPLHEAPRYVLGEVIGRGGMGEVHAATDTRLEREVAVKVLRAGRAGWQERFLEEARVTAGLEHPNIVPVHDLGALEDGRPYLAMKRVRGRSLTELMKDGQLSQIEARLEIFRKLCDAVAFAHARGVLHRDLKPDNVMVGEFGEVVLMDWGIAAALDLALANPSAPAGAIMGTPAFMAPEQAQGEACTPQTDVYGLGAVLYELLVGQPPFQGHADRVLLLVSEGMLTPPRQHAPDLAPELERVILRAMALAPADRYPSARALREDIDAVLARRPLVHLRSTPSERLAKWMDRHARVLRVVGVASILGLLAFALGSWRYAVDVGDARDAAVEAAGRAQAAEAEVTAGLVAAQVALADALSGQGRVLEADDHLREADALLQGRVLDRRALDLAWSQHVADNPPPLSRCAPHGGAGVRALDIRPDGRSVVSVGDDGRLVSWDPVGCAELQAVRLGEAVGPAAVDASRGFAAVIVGDALVLASLQGGPMASLPAPPGARKVGLDGETIWVRDGDAAIWTLAPDQRTLERQEAPPLTGTIWRPALGARLWLAESTRTGGELGGVWRARDGAALYRSDGINGAALSSDGRRLITGTATEVSVIDLEGKESWARPQEPVHAVGVAPGDRVGWSQSFDGSVRVVDLKDGAQLAVYVGPGDLPSATAATVDARLMAIAGANGEVLTYLRPAFPSRRPPQQGAAPVHGLAVNADGRLLATADDGGNLTLLDAATAQVLRRWSGFRTGVRQIAFSPDGLRIAAAARYDGLAIMDLLSGAVRAVPLPVRAVSVAWLPGGVYSVDVEGRLLRLDPDTGVVTPLGQGLRAASWGLAAVGDDTLLTAGHFGEERGLALLSAEDGHVIRRIPIEQIGYHVAVSPDRRRAAVGGHLGQALIVDLETGAVLQTLQADAGPTLGVAFSPDGQLLATTGYARQVKIWDLARGELLRAVHQHEGPGLSLRFSPDGDRLYSGGTDGWRVLPLRARAQHEAAVAALATPGASRVAALATLGWWERVEEVAGEQAGSRAHVAAARLALGQPPLSPGEDPYLRLLAAADGGEPR